MNPELLASVAAWCALDPDERTRAELEALVAAGDEVELTRRFATPLTFGTAGLRGPVMAGPSGMNRLTVRRATQGVIAWLAALGLDGSKGVVVGRDGRHGSEDFNDETIAVLLGAGVVVYEMPSPLPTPLVAYCVKALGAVAGIMITASHNPAPDNGYKLYGPDGSQIIAPNDAIVEAAMAAATTPTLADRSSSLHRVVSDDVLEGYRAHMLARFGVPRNNFSIVYTPMQGVGGQFMLDLFARAGYDNVHPVTEQMTPDATFSTVAFPNPEEPGALDLALELASSVDASVILANDPDADRLSLAARGRDGNWRILRGDEIGWLLGAALLAQAQPGDVVANSIVSSTMLGDMARAAGVTHVETLTGFKWVAKAAGTNRLLFGYEEAIGFGVDSLVGDKDGLSAALALAQLLYELDRAGLTAFDRLDELETRYGVHAGSQVSLRVTPPAGREVLLATMARVRQSPPATLGGLEVTEVVDLEQGWRGLPATEGLLWRLGDQGRVLVRPSGTEPKLKAYVEVVGPAGAEVVESRARCAAVVAAVADDLRQLLAL
jgi:phosphomannomutase